MPKTIISDTSCFILLTNIGELDLLSKIYATIVTTPEVASEFGDMLPDWVTIEAVQDLSKQKILELQVDKDEASAIALALETVGSTLIIDDLRARKVADKLKISYTGTVGVVIKAKIIGVIPSIKPFIDKIKRTDFMISNEIEEQALKEAGEK